MRHPYDDLAVLVIDMQYGFLKHIDAYQRRALVRNQIRVLRHCEEFDIQTWKIELPKRNFGETAEPIRNALKRVPRDWSWAKESDSVFSPLEARCFAGELQRKGIRTIFLMGLNADACVYDSAFDAYHLGFEVATHHTVIGAPFTRSTISAVERLNKLGCHIAQFEDLLLQVGAAEYATA